MATELVNLRLTEVSVVDHPANKGARIVLLKSDEAPELKEIKSEKSVRPRGSQKERAMFSSTEKVSLLKRLMAALKFDQADLDDFTPEDDDVTTEKRLEALAAQVEKLGQDADVRDVAKAIEAALDSEDASGALELLEKRVTALVEKAGSDKDAEITRLQKQLEDAQTTAVQATKAADETSAFRERLPKSLQKAFDGMGDDDKKGFMSRFSKGASVEDSDDPIAKALAAVVKSSDALLTRVEGLEARTEKSSLRTELAGIDGLVDLDKTIETVARLRKSDPGAADLFVEQLRATQAQAKSAKVFGELGSSQIDKSGTDADVAITKAVTKIRENDPTIGEDEAMAKAFDANPDLYTQYLADHPDQTS